MKLFILSARSNSSIQQVSVLTASVLLLISFGASPMPRQGISFAIDSLNLGWETAKTTGLRQEDVFARKDGSWAISGVMSIWLPNTPIMATMAYGVQVTIQRSTLVIATLSFWLLFNESTFIFFAWAFMAASWATTAL